MVHPSIETDAVGTSNVDSCYTCLSSTKDELVSSEE